MEEWKPYIVGLGGTSRPNSSSELALLSALRAAEALGARTRTFVGADLQFPHYELRGDTLSPLAEGFIRELSLADAVVVSSPCYHGAMSGAVKNAIDYIEELRGNERVYLDGRACGVIGCGLGYQGPTVVVQQLRQIAHALRAWPTPLGVSINTAVTTFNDGACSDERVTMQLAAMAEQLVTFARAMHTLSEKMTPFATVGRA